MPGRLASPSPVGPAARSLHDVLQPAKRNSPRNRKSQEPMQVGSYLGSSVIWVSVSLL